MIEVEVLKFYPFELPGRRGGLVGYADVRIGDLLIIRSVKLMKNRHGGYYVQMPDVFRADRVFEPVEIISKDLMSEIRRKVVDFYRERYKIS